MSFDEVVKSGLESVVLDGAELVEGLDSAIECIVCSRINRKEVFMLISICFVNISIVVVLRLVANLDYFVRDALDFSLDSPILCLGLTLCKSILYSCVLEGVDSFL